MSSVTYTYKQLEDLCTEAFTRFGFSREDAAQITDVLLLADLYGTRSHGTQRLRRHRRPQRHGSADFLLCYEAGH